MAQKDLDAVLMKYSESGDISVLEDALGYNPGSLAGKKIYMMHIDNPKVKIPSGNEGGANSLWRPGGLTHPGGQAEAVLDNIPINHNNSLSNLTSNFNVTEI
jgi:hypothetical protein